MNILWYVLCRFYVLGLIVAVPLFLIVVANFSSDVEVSIMLLIGCIVYFSFGYLLFKTIPSWFNARIMTRVDRYKSKGFAPQSEVVSVIYRHYVGFDSKDRKVLYINMSDGTETLIDFDNVNRWELDEFARHKPVNLKLLTRIPALPAIVLPIDGCKSDEWKANLGMIFG